MPNNDDNGTKKITDNGVELETSVLDAVQAVVAFSGPQGAAIVVGVKMVILTMEILGFLGYLENVVSIPDALNSLQNQINKIKADLDKVMDRINVIVNDQAAAENRATLQRLLDYHKDIRENNLALLNTPDHEVAMLVNIANRSGIQVDTFLRNDYDIWRWTDVEVLYIVDPITGNIIREEHYLARNKFKNQPTLPVYLMALLTWLAARERVVLLGESRRLDDDAGRITRHLAAVSVRPGFDKYRDGEFGIPKSIAENIKWRIRAFPRSVTAHPVNRVCKWSFDVQNWMSGKRKGGDNFDVYVENDNVLCTINPNTIGMPELEIDTEIGEGVELLYEMSQTLEHVAKTGTLKKPKPLEGTFSTAPSYPPAFLYLVGLNGDVNWYRNYSSSQPNGSTEWSGPKKVKEGWGSYARFFNAGGQSVYYIDREGNLFGQKHKGFVTGAVDWSDTVRVGWGWNSFAHVFSGGENVIYAMEPNGTLRWYKHIGGPLGANPSDWVGHYRDVTPPATLAGMPWDRLVFSGGKGNIYSVTDTGELRWLEHRGYRDGTNEWAYGGSPSFLNGGWGHYVHVVAAPEYVFYGLTAYGELHWRRYLPDSRTWEGPITMLRGVPACRAVFVVLEGPPPVVH